MIYKLTNNILNKLSKFSRNIENSDIYLRRFYQLYLDFSILIFSTFLSFNLSKVNLNNFNNELILYFLIVSIGLIVYIFTGQYKGLTKYRGSYFQYILILRNTLIIILTIFCLSLFNNEKQITQNHFWIILWLVINFLSGSSRIVIRDIILNLRIYKPNKLKVVIYGAGDAGSQLAKSLILNGKYKVLAFIDDNKELWDRNIFGIKILSPNNLSRLKNTINQVLVAIPSVPIKRKKEILNKIYSNHYSVLQVPSLDDITSGKLHIENLKPITIDDLLGRKKSIQEKIFDSSEINKKVICVTGAGGSIGSELCRQIIKLNPKNLILFDNCELNLYKIHQELLAVNKNTIPLLGNACEENLLIQIFKKYNVDTVLHAAAYKHVPLVETNPIEGIKNNIISSLSICKACEKSEVKKAILISSDKAVRPTNIMGVSKRISELIFQAFADNNKESLNSDNLQSKIFSMVRFGNVLDSSGSVIPLFKKQINEGGPITITDPKVERYFMTIPEASHLVLQATKFAKGGEIFLLEMGSPIKIIDLAKQMIKLSGLNLKDKNNLNGDINIEYIGLRPGEKLYEELLISGESKSTSHPKVFFANENYIKSDILFPLLENLSIEIKNLNEKEIKKILNRLVPEWNAK